MNQAILNRARIDKFFLVLDLPKVLKNVTDPILQENTSIDKLQFSCYGSPVPSIEVKHLDVSYGGQVYKTSSTVRDSYPPLNVTFLVDNGWKNYWLLCKWINLFNEQSTAEVSYNFSDRSQSFNHIQDLNRTSIKDLVSIFKTYALDEYNNKIIEFEYTHAFPTNLSEIKFSHRDSEEITCNVSFSYFQFKTNLLKNVESSVNC